MLYEILRGLKRDILWYDISDVIIIVGHQLCEMFYGTVHEMYDDEVT